MLSARELPARYNLIPFLSVHDPEADVKNIVSDVLQIVGTKFSFYYKAKAYVTSAHRGLPPRKSTAHYSCLRS